MNENGTKKREWVKTAAIIFLSVLLVLTFFSQTIMNYSLPEVAVQYVMSGTVTAKVRGTGTIESGDPYEVDTKYKGRTIESVKFREGDKVEKGDILFVLKEGEENAELVAARTELENAMSAYDKVVKQVQAAFLTGSLSEKVYHNIQSGTSTSYAEYSKRMADAEAKITECTNWGQKIEYKLAQLNAAKDGLQYTVPDTTAEAKAYHDAELFYNEKNSALSAAQADLAEKQNLLYEAEKYIRDYNAGITVSGSDVESDLADALDKTAKLPAVIETIKVQVAGLEQETYNAKADMDKKKTALDNKTNQTESMSALSGEIVKWEKERDVNANNLKAAEDVKAQVVEEINLELGGNGTYDLATPRKAIEDAREKVEKLEAEVTGNTVEAPISGTITSIVAAGSKTSDEAGPKVLAVMQPEGKGFTMKFSVSNDQAKRLSVGDKADLVNAWWYNDVDVTLANIRPDPQDPGKQKELTFDIKGDVMAGQSLSVSVGQKSANYDLIVPNSALREDNNGKFILIVESKSSPLGNRYYARRVDVEVLAGDDTQSAISAGIYGYEYVITTSTAPVEAGKLVRLANN